jgi:hypothetical protein
MSIDYPLAFYSNTVLFLEALQVFLIPCEENSSGLVFSNSRIALDSIDQEALKAHN